ncbi:MAG TPA: ACT domain-containing protein [Polyangiaceae bacterium]|nr:ACT domain-containing protein [Polyangiaceae bacterium]
MSRELTVDERIKNVAPRLRIEVLDYLERHHHTLCSIVTSGRRTSGIEACHFRMRVFDGLLDTLFHYASAMVAGPYASQRALGAVGSYARGSLMFHGGIDVRLVIDSRDPDVDRFVRAMFRPLWDARVAIDVQVHHAESMIVLAENDWLGVASSLDWRHVAGHEKMSTQLMKTVRDRVLSHDGFDSFLRRLESDGARRYQRFGHSAYQLEPHVKYGAGGMRDLETVLWIAKARWNATGFTDMVRHGLFNPEEISELQLARSHLCRIHNLPHLLSGCRSDRMSFDMQPRLASSLGYGDSAEAVERLMKEHYVHVNRVLRAKERIIDRARSAPSADSIVERLPVGFCVNGDRIAISDVEALAENPILALTIFQFAIARQMRMDSDTLSLLRRALKMRGFQKSVRSIPRSGDAFLSLCCSVQETRLPQDSPLSVMLDVGLLTTFIPEFKALAGRRQRDAYHVLTVDAHCIAAVDLLRKLVRGEKQGSHSLFRRLAMEMARPRIVLLATLLHDVGKAVAEKRHAMRGAPIAFEVAHRLGMSCDDAHEVAHLVRHHKLLNQIASRRDVDDPNVWEEVAQVAHGREGLRELLLLSFVVISSTSPDAMTVWKRQWLERLFVRVDAHLRQRADFATRSAGVHSKIERIVMEQDNDETLRQYLRTMPERYILGQNEAKLVAHAHVAMNRKPQAVRVAVFTAFASSLAEVLVIADDRPGLLAVIAAVFMANQLSVLEAFIHSRKRSPTSVEAVDMFHVVIPEGATIKALRQASFAMEKTISDILAGNTSSEQYVRGQKGAVHAFGRSEIVVDNEASGSWTIVETFSEDRPGLLYTVANAFHDLRLNIQFAKINTEGTRAANVFYVSETDGSKVMDAARIDAIEQRLQEALR